VTGSDQRRMSRMIVFGIAVFSLLIVLALSFHFNFHLNNERSGGVVGDEWKIRVMVTIPPQAEFVRSVGGENVVVDIMIPPGENPHVYEPEPGRLINLSRARMYVMMGSGIEFERVWMDKIISVNSEMLIVNCSKGIELINEGGGAADPHIWLSPRNAKIIVRNIYEGLVEIDPANRSYYESNMNSYINALDELDRRISEKLSQMECRKILVYHPAWAYFARDYGLEQISIEKEGKDPTPEGIAHIIEQAKSEGIDTVFVSPQFSRETADVIADAIGGNVVVIDPLAENYLENMGKIAEMIAAS